MAATSTSSKTYISTPILKIEGVSETDIEELMHDVLRIEIEESLHYPAMFTLILHNNYIPTSNNEPWRNDNHLTMGKKVEIGFANSISQSRTFKKPKEGTIIKAEITAIDVNFSNRSESHIIVRGYDFSHRLHRGRHNRSFQDMTDSDIVKKIVKEAGLESACDATGSPRDYVFQENQTNMEFIQQLTARNGFELFFQDGKLHFRKPVTSQTLELHWLQEITSFNVRMSSAQQVSSVEVRAWDYERKQTIIETADSETVVTTTGNKDGSSTATKFNIAKPKMIVVDQPSFSAKEAKSIAQSLCDELGGEFIYADAKTDCNGNPEIRAGRLVKLEDLGNYSGNYYITETRHIYQKKVYSTDFSVRGLRDGSLLSILAPQTHLGPGQTLMVGIVTHNKDPEGWGRVKVKLPTLTEDHVSNWARVVAIGASNDRGFDCLPEIDDEVLVGFEHGDIHRPYIIGGVWNGKDTPPEKIDDTIQGGKVRLRTIQTRTGHKIQFVEEDKGSSKAGIYIKTSGGHTIRMNDSDRCIEIETSKGHKMTMDDGDRSISLSSIGDLSIDAKKNINIKANLNVTVEGKFIYLN